jgi:hypothetical protein
MGEVEMATIAARVTAGAEFLDRVEPGWARRIDLDVLDLVDCDVCVIGQLAGVEAERGVAALVGHDVNGERWPTALGFHIDVASPDDDDWDWALLTDAWKRAITARRAASADAP